MKQTLRQLAETLGCRLIGDSSVAVTTVSSLHGANKESLVFAEDAQRLDDALRSPAAAVITGKFASDRASLAKPILITEQPRLTFARASRLLRTAETKNAVHTSAIMAVSAKTGTNVAVGRVALSGIGSRFATAPSLARDV
jgi:UDP-3-O-[3-hydroxymyristoyl] glucosamine N-acyltransferase